MGFYCTWVTQRKPNRPLNLLLGEISVQIGSRWFVRTVFVSILCRSSGAEKKKLRFSMETRQTRIDVLASLGFPPLCLSATEGLGPLLIHGIRGGGGIGGSYPN